MGLSTRLRWKGNSAIGTSVAVHHTFHDESSKVTEGTVTVYSKMEKPAAYMRCRRHRLSIILLLLFLLLIKIGIIPKLLLFRIGMDDKLFPDRGLQKLECMGTPQERRALASLGDSVSSERWRAMTECVMEREKRLKGIFALHISKSGGTSLCNVFKNEHCYNKKSNCYVSPMETKFVNLSPKWYRIAAAKHFNLSKLSVLQPNNRQSTCDDIGSYLHQFQQKLAMSENWLPSGGVCQDNFMNVIMVRDPMDRLISHYSHILRLCQKRNVNDRRCDEMIVKPTHMNHNSNVFIFNMTTMMKHFDIITDNYMTRSLNTREAYQAPLGHMSEYSQSAMDNLRKFDWILLLDDGKNDDSTNRLLMKGLGLSSYLRKAMVKPRSQEVSVSNGDKQMLLNLNRFDYAIWSEARRLHELDVQSLKYMEKYGHDLYANRDERVKGDSSCCGGVCVS